MKPVMKVTVKQANPNVKSYEGLVDLPNLNGTKLKKENGGTHYTTVSNLKQAALAAAKKYNAVLNFVAPQQKVAAKRSTR